MGQLLSAEYKVIFGNNESNFNDEICKDKYTKDGVDGVISISKKERLKLLATSAETFQESIREEYSNYSTKWLTEKPLEAPLVFECLYIVKEFDDIKNLRSGPYKNQDCLVLFRSVIYAYLEVLQSREKIDTTIVTSLDNFYQELDKIINKLIPKKEQIKITWKSPYLLNPKLFQETKEAFFQTYPKKDYPRLKKPNATDIDCQTCIVDLALLKQLQISIMRLGNAADDLKNYYASSTKLKIKNIFRRKQA